MNYGYDAQGNRVHRDGGGGSDSGADSENARIQAVHDPYAMPNDEAKITPSANDSGDSDRNEEEGIAEGSALPDGNDNGSDSDFSDDVELVIGEMGNQSVDQPLVETVDLSRQSRHRKETEAFLQLEAAPRGKDHLPQKTLLIGDNAEKRVDSLTKVEKERLQAQTFLDTVARVPSRVRTVALAGTLHHGKTSLLDLLLDGKSYTPRKEEESRKISLKTHVMAAFVRGAHLCKSTNLVTFVDTPGHPDFIGEINAGVRLADAVLFCVDAFESLDGHGERLLRQIIVEEQLPIILVVTKLDRLILELKLPPLDAYRKLRVVVEAVNNVITSCGGDSNGSASDFLVSPENGTVLFSSSTLGFMFSLETFALKYASMYKEGTVDFACLAQKLWGQVTFDQGTFKKITNFRQRPSFVSFVLEPLYKIVAHSVSGKGAEQLSTQLTKLPRSPASAMQEAIRLFLGSPSSEGIDALLNVLPLSGQRRTETLGCKYNLLQQQHDSIFALPPRDADNAKSAVAESAEERGSTPVAAVAPLVCVFTATSEVAGSSSHKTRKQHRTAFVMRILSGILRANPAPKTIGKKRENVALAPSASAQAAFVTVDERSDSVSPFHETRLQKLFVRVAERGFVEVQAAYPGQVVYATLDGDGIDADAGGAGDAAAAAGAHASRHLVLIGGRPAKALLSLGEDANNQNSNNHNSGSNQNEEEEAYAVEVEQWVQGVQPWAFSYLGNEPFVHVSLELKDPTELSTYRHGLDLLRRTTPGLDLRAEENGEFTMTGFGELHLDTALHQLRTSLCPDVAMGLSQPFVSFSETVLDGEGVLAVAGTRAKGTVGCTSGALPRTLATAVEKSLIHFFPPSTDIEARQQLHSTLRKEYGLDALDAQHVLALGPDKGKGPSLLIDDTLVEEYGASQKSLTQAQRNAIIAGFRDAMRNGPLTGETVRGVGVKLIFTEAATDKTVRLNELRSNTRLAVRRSLFGARPRLLEPVLGAEILCPPECLEKITTILHQRRGAVLGEEAIPATTLTRIRALVPAIDSFGLETQIRMLTHGQAYPMFTFRQWDVVPGDPYDASIHVGPMEPAKGYQAARDFVLKTRFRKGLSQELTADI